MSDSPNDWRIEAVSVVEEYEADPYVGRYGVTVFFWTEAEAQQFADAMQPRAPALNVAHPAADDAGNAPSSSPKKSED